MASRIVLSRSSGLLIWYQLPKSWYSQRFSSPHVTGERRNPQRQAAMPTSEPAFFPETMGPLHTYCPVSSRLHQPDSPFPRPLFQGKVADTLGRCHVRTPRSPHLGQPHLCSRCCQPFSTFLSSSDWTEALLSSAIQGQARKVMLRSHSRKLGFREAIFEPRCCNQQWPR